MTRYETFGRSNKDIQKIEEINTNEKNKYVQMILN